MASRRRGLPHPAAENLARETALVVTTPTARGPIAPHDRPTATLRSGVAEEHGRGAARHLEEPAADPHQVRIDPVRDDQGDPAAEPALRRPAEGALNGSAASPIEVGDPSHGRSLDWACGPVV